MKSVRASAVARTSALGAGAALARFGAAAVLTARAGPEAAGMFVVANAFASAAAGFTGWGTEYSGAVILGRHRERVGHALVVALLAAGVTGLVVGAIVAVLQSAGLVFRGQWPSALALQLAALAATVSLGQAIGSILVGLGRVDLFAAGSLAHGVTLLGVFAFAPDATALLIAAPAVLYAAVIAGQLVAVRAGNFAPLRIRYGLLAWQLRFGVGTVAASLARTANARVGLFVAASTLSQAAVGVLGMAQIIGDSFLLIPTAAGQHILASRSASPRMAQYARLAAGIALLAAASATIAGLFGDELIQFATGRTLAGVGGFTAAYLVAAMFHGIALIAIHLKLADGRSTQVAHIHWVGAAVSISTLLFLSDFLGVWVFPTAAMAGYAALLVTAASLSRAAPGR